MLSDNKTNEEIDCLIKKEMSDEDSPIRNACIASRKLYLAQEFSRIISRKNLDLIFPRMPQLYLAQWKLLSNLTALILLYYSKTTKKTRDHSLSIREISYMLQKILWRTDKVIAPYKKIPPSHFDYEHIYLRLVESLESSTSLIDRNSRAHMGIYESKYFCHDDHNDSGFRMEYTLAYLYAPVAQYWVF